MIARIEATRPPLAEAEAGFEIGETVGHIQSRVEARFSDGAKNRVYEEASVGDENSLTLLRNPDEEASVEAIAAGLRMCRVGFVFSQALGRVKGEYTLSGREVVQAAELHAEGGIEERVTVLVKLEVNEEGAANVHFEALISSAPPPSTSATSVHASGFVHPAQDSVMLQLRC